MQIIFRLYRTKDQLFLLTEPTHSGDDNEGNGDAGDDFSRHGSVGFLYEIPQTDLVLDELSAAEILFNLFFNIIGFFLHLLDNVFLPCVVFILTAGF